MPSYQQYYANQMPQQQNGYADPRLLNQSGYFTAGQMTGYPGAPRQNMAPQFGYSQQGAPAPMPAQYGQQPYGQSPQSPQSYPYQPYPQQRRRPRQLSLLTKEAADEMPYGQAAPSIGRGNAADMYQPWNSTRHQPYQAHWNPPSY